MENVAYGWLLNLIHQAPGGAVVPLEAAQMFGVGLTAQGVMYAMDRLFTGTMPGQEATRSTWWPRLVSRAGPIMTVAIGGGVAAAHHALGDQMGYGVALMGGALSPFTYKATHELILPPLRGAVAKFRPAAAPKP